MKITVLFRLISFEKVYQVSQDRENTLAFGFDQSRTVLILLYTHKDDRKNPPKYVKIVDLKDAGDFKVLYDQTVSN